MNLFARAAALTGVVLLSGCGFTPLYAERGVSPSLAVIEVEAPQTRTGYLLREELDDAFGRDQGQAPVYRLEMTIDEDRYARGLRVDDVATRYELRLAVTYRLIAQATAAPVTQGYTEVSVTYDSADQPYAGVSAATDGQERAATQAAQRIRLDLARYFALADRRAAPAP